LKIKSADEFLKVFPYAGAYCIDGEMVIPFALARVMIDRIDSKVYVMEAFQILYGIVNDRELARDVKRIYGYDYRSFAAETAKYDIFSAIDDERYLNSKLRFDFGGGFGEAGCIEKRVYVDNTNRFFVDADVAEVVGAQGYVAAVSFMPDTSRVVSCLIDKVEIDGVEAAVCAVGGVRSGGFDHFPETLPEYRIEVGKDRVSKILISGAVDYTGVAQLRAALDEALQINRELCDLLDKSNDVIQRLTGK
jgi:hypothetical protein